MTVKMWCKFFGKNASYEKSIFVRYYNEDRGGTEDVELVPFLPILHQIALFLKNFNITTCMSCKLFQKFVV